MTVFKKFISCHQLPCFAPFVKRCLDAVVPFVFFAFWNTLALSKIQVTVSSLLEMNMKESQPTWFTTWMSVWKFLSRALFGHSMSTWVELCWSGSTQGNKWSSKNNNSNCPAQSLVPYCTAGWLPRCYNVKFWIDEIQTQGERGFLTFACSVLCSVQSDF